MKTLLHAGWVLMVAWNEASASFRAVGTRGETVIAKSAPEPMEAVACVMVAALGVTQVKSTVAK